MEDERLRSLLEVGRSLIAELDLDTILERLLEVARGLTGCHYAAIGVLDERRTGLERFVVSGMDEETQHMLGEPPHGRGVLGVLIRDPRPLRLATVSAHPHSYGFPPGHPRMATFLGVPILIRGEAWGNLYLTEKEGGEFTDDDEESVIVLAEWAAIAIDHARLYRAEHDRRAELERANRRLETTIEVSRGLGGMTDVDAVLELVVKRSRALLDARAAEVALVDGDGFVVAAVAGEGVSGLEGSRIPAKRSLAGIVLERRATTRFDDVPPDSFAFQRLGARRAVASPMRFRNRIVGVLMVLDRFEHDGPFTADEGRLLEAFAASAATAVATAQSARDEAMRRGIRASEQERRRWARELHDQTLQDMAALRMTLSVARNSPDPADLATVVDEAVELLGDGVASLRSLINDLRPPALDELGVVAALESLVERAQRLSGLGVEFRTNLRDSRHDRLDTDLESTIYRLVQEGLTNVMRHAQADQAVIEVRECDDVVEVEIRDDGCGMDADRHHDGFGLLGMRERLALLRGTLEITSEPGGGTTVRATLPLDRAQASSSVPVT